MAAKDAFTTIVDSAKKYDGSAEILRGAKAVDCAAPQSARLTQEWEEWSEKLHTRERMCVTAFREGSERAGLDVPTGWE
jgi:hypothetical protein